MAHQENEWDRVQTPESGGGWAAPQRTLARPFELTGLALHGGEPVRVCLRPTQPDHGIVFQRIDLPGRPEIPARPESLQEGVRSTILGSGGATVRTVEHLLAAAFGLGVDNLQIEIDGPELPVGDGSAKSWVDGMLAAGIVTLPAQRGWRRLRSPVVVEDRAAGAYLLAAPSPTFEATYVFHPPYCHQPVQVASYSLPPRALGSPTGPLGSMADPFIRQIAPARTLALAEELDELAGRGLGRGVGADQVVILGSNGPQGPTRFPDEPARHKLLDLLGDFSLVGPMLACLVAIRSGHRQTAKLIRQIAALTPDD